VEQLVDGLQLVGFLMVGVTILAALVAGVICITVFLHMTDRKIGIGQGPLRPRETDVPAEIRS
jgi:hypothetical protein